MRLTTKGRYAVTAMLDLAYHSQQDPVTLTDIATRQTISLSYLEQLFARLRRAGMVTGVRGPGGGYRLSRAANEINIAEIIEAVDEPLDTTKCAGEGNCQNNKACLTHDLWMGLSDQIRGYLKGISLGDLLTRHHVQEVAKRQEQDTKMVEIHRQQRVGA
ncbi:Fe-S cluster assembly transcriptional regulator IscR [Methylotuvimicrobium alcaliphilum]|uniref:Iron-sulfur cluster assembly transcription factor IscR n=1 Tax=Methylotuvimicrobium alcaliphilum (strain DSM 19304 / NCIMB 14124 / VKM B-2133 / 20Z) TaxID=1091494 RepID=G4SZK1_META2|nr:Fe-S cluster assembly transcriptional regulator IscR [Methylotuvimicrobium alcaliphilum]CCE24442.1 Iron-sulfur cluster assembly transcription factor IscR [Methylotuvimicrobium alcaliphilum 20Z]